jgi:hypothetical protein
MPSMLRQSEMDRTSIPVAFTGTWQAPAAMLRSARASHPYVPGVLWGELVPCLYISCRKRARYITASKIYLD